MGPSEQLRHYLDETQTPYEFHHHLQSMTALELAEVENMSPHEVAKVVILKDEKHHYMMVLPADYQLDLLTTREFLGSPHATLATEEELATLFPDCEIGSMPPFGILYQMPVYAEQDMNDSQVIEFHAGSHEDAVRMGFNAWKNIVHPQMGHFSDKRH